MKDHKLNQLFKVAGKEIPPTPPEGFDIRVARSLGRKTFVETISLWDQLGTLFPRVAFAALLLAAVCVVGDVIHTSPELAGDLENLSAQWLFAGNPV